METQVDLTHDICGACRADVGLKKKVTIHKGDKLPEKKRCCRCGYSTLYSVTVRKAYDGFYCQKNNIHEER